MGGFRDQGVKMGGFGDQEVETGGFGDQEVEMGGFRDRVETGTCKGGQLGLGIKGWRRVGLVVETGRFGGGDG